MQAPPPGSQIPLLPLHRDQLGPISFKTLEAREAQLLLWPKAQSSQGRGPEPGPPELSLAFPRSRRVACPTRWAETKHSHGEDALGPGESLWGLSPDTLGFQHQLPL